MNVSFTIGNTAAQIFNLHKAIYATVTGNTYGKQVANN
jgi:hypothetical protein